MTSRSGFSLAELLVAMAILGLIGLVIGQMVGTTAKITVLNGKHTDANSQARSVFDRMEEDFGRMVKRNDVDYIFWKSVPGSPNGPNDTMYFYSEAPAYFTSGIFNNGASPPLAKTTPYPFKSSIALVGYRVNNDVQTPSPNIFQLERLGKPLAWDSGPMSGSGFPTPVVFLTYPSPPPIATTSLDPNPGAGAPYSTALFNSTLAGAFSNQGSLPSAVGTQAGGSTTAPSPTAIPTTPASTTASAPRSFASNTHSNSGTAPSPASRSSPPPPPMASPTAS